MAANDGSFRKKASLLTWPLGSWSATRAVPPRCTPALRSQATKTCRREYGGVKPHPRDPAWAALSGASGSSSCSPWVLLQRRGIWRTSFDERTRVARTRDHGRPCHRLGRVHLAHRSVERRRVRGDQTPQPDRHACCHCGSAGRDSVVHARILRRHRTVTKRAAREEAKGRAKPR